MPHQCTNCGKTFADGSKEMLSGCPDCGGNKFQFRPTRAAAAERSDAESESTPGSATRAADTSRDSNRDRSDRSGVSGTAAKAGASVREWVGNRTSSERTDDSSNTASGAQNAANTQTDDTASTNDVTIEPADEPSSEQTTTEQSTEPRSSQTSAPEESPASQPVEEDSAQASARSDVVTPEELSAAQNRPIEEQPGDADGTVIEPESDERPDLSDLREELNDQFESIKILQPGQYELNLMELYDRDEYIISLREDGRYVIEVPDTWRQSESDD